MSQAWSQLRDIEGLADSQADLEFSIPLSAFPGVPPQPEGSAAEVQGRARFHREGGFAVVELTVSGHMQLICQRCLAPMSQPIEGGGRIALVASEAEADRVPPELEPVRAPEGRIRLRDLVEEELLLAMPIVPLHESSADCASQAAPVGEVADAGSAPAESLQRPFAALAELLKR